MTLLELQDLTLRSAGTTRVASVNANVQPGRVTAVLGANGSGKSSLLALMAGQLAPTDGRVLLHGEAVHRMKPLQRARELAWLGQSTPGAEAYSARDVITWGRTCRRVTRSAVTGDTGDLMERLGIAHLADKPLGRLSGGERQRVHLARIWEQDAPVTLLDEPDAAMDVTGRELLRQLITDATDSGRSIVIVTHDRLWAQAVADEVWIMDAGTLTAQ